MKRDDRIMRFPGPLRPGAKGDDLDLDGDLDIGGSITNVETIQFDITFSDGSVEGRLQWSQDDQTLELGLPGGNVNLQIGQENLIRAKNVEGSTIANGTPIYIFGASGANPTVKVASNDVFAESLVIAIATEDVDNNQFGYFNAFGLIRDVDTSSFSPGDTLWLGVNGAITNVRPTAGASLALMTVVGVCLRRHATEGVIFGTIDIVPRLQGLSDVDIDGSMADGEVVQWIGANSRFENAQITRRTRTLIDDTDSPYAQLITDQIIYCNTSAGDIEIDLLVGANSDNQEFEINCEGINEVTLDPNGSDTFNGNPSLILVDGDSVRFQWNGTEWRAL